MKLDGSVNSHYINSIIMIMIIIILIFIIMKE